MQNSLHRHGYYSALWLHTKKKRFVKHLKCSQHTLGNVTFLQFVQLHHLRKLTVPVSASGCLP